MSPEVLELAKQLIACPSLTPNDAGCQSILRNRLEPLGFQCETFKIGEVENVWARLGKHSPLLVLAGHTDVVPPGPESAWTSPPFVPEVREGFLYGRGACDMKGALAAMIVAVERFLQNHGNFPGSVAFLITSDEEGPGENGTKKVIEILQKRNEKIDFCLIGEASSDKQLGDQIRVGRRGSLHGKLIIHGKQGHVAYPHLAENPIHQVAPALQDLIQEKWDTGNDHFPETTFQITNMHAGTGARNVVPNTLEILFNLRFSTANSPEQIQQKTVAILHKHHLKFDLEWHVGGLPFLTQHGKLLDATRSAIQKITHLDTQLSTGGGTSDGRFIAPTGAEVVELGVIHATAHQINECVKVQDLATLTEIYHEILRQLF